VLTPTTWWLELARRADPGALKVKFAQGQRDIAAAQKAGKPWTRVAAVCRKSGSPEIKVALSLLDLVEAAGDGLFLAEGWTWDIPVVIGYDHFLKLVEDEHARGR
jgi:hypothetical protein